VAAKAGAVNASINIKAITVAKNRFLNVILSFAVDIIELNSQDWVIYPDVYIILSNNLFGIQYNLT